MQKISCLLLLMSFVAASTKAQTVEITGQIRPRAEFKNGYKSLISENMDPAFAISQRSRITANFTSKKIITSLSIQDVRIWGDVSTANKSDLNGIMVHQAWGEYSVCSHFSIKAGRQIINYDDQRLFGGNDWIQQARSHDALLLKFAPIAKLNMHIGVVYNQSADKDTGTFYTLNNYKALQYFWGHYEAEKLGLSFLFSNNGLIFNTAEGEKTIQQVRYSQTFGPYIAYKSGALKINAATYLQIGKNNKDKKKSAFYGSIELNYAVSKLFNAGAGFQYLSGNSQLETSNTDNEFSTLYGTGHKFNGYMDYFYAGNGHKGVGLLDIYLPFTYKKNKLTTELRLHYFTAAADVKDPKNTSKAMNSGLGTETDLMLIYTVSPEMSISCGYSQIFGTETLKVLKGGDNKNIQNWTWVMLSFNPTFFKSEK